MAITCHPHLTKVIIILVILSIILFVINYKEQTQRLNQASIMGSKLPVRQNFQDITLSDVNQLVTQIKTNQDNILKDLTSENLALIKQNLHNWQV